MKVFVWFKDNMMRFLSGESLPLIEAFIGAITTAIVAILAFMICIALLIPVVITFPIWSLIYVCIKTRNKEGNNGEN